MTTVEELKKAKLDNLKALEKAGFEAFPYKFDRTHYSVELHEKYDKKLKAGNKTKDKVSVSGRVMVIRGFGGLTFIVLQDGKGQIQICVKKGYSSKKSLKILKFLNRGDFVGAKGEIFKTKKGETTVLVSELIFLSKSLLPLPEKFHGLQDLELRHRQRHLDLIMNKDSKKVFELRTKIIKLIKQFLDSHDFLEVETPLIQPVYGGANARPFVTYSYAWKSNFFLSVSPELYLKRLIVGGFDKVYTICKNFRNEDVDKTHNPEFTMLEFYATNWDYNDVMSFVEQLIEFVVKEIHGSTKFSFQGKEFDVKIPWKKLTMYDALKKIGKLDVKKTSDEELKKLLKEHKIDLPTNSFVRGWAIAKLFEKLCEAELIQPVHLIDHPKETVPFCKLHKKDPDLIERVEPYINSWEIGNGYSELNNPIKQKELFEEQEKMFKNKDEKFPKDLEFVEVMEYGMPPTGGFGLGIDRLVMLLTDSPTIRDVILFPQMRFEQKHFSEKK